MPHVRSCGQMRLRLIPSGREPHVFADLVRRVQELQLMSPRELAHGQIERKATSAASLSSRRRLHLRSMREQLRGN
jgi:hypothetical protein